MSDTTIRKCKKCGNDFDSIYQTDGGVCDDCREEEGFIELRENFFYKD